MKYNKQLVPKKSQFASVRSKDNTMILKLLFVFVCVSLAVRANVDETAPRVKIPLGGVKGYYKTSQNGRKYEAYEGIPYALPPTGKLRFKVNIRKIKYKIKYERSQTRC